MIGSSKNNRENYPRKCFGTQERETRVKFNPRLSANRLSNNWALFPIRVAGAYVAWKNPSPRLLVTALSLHLLSFSIPSS